jgi:hypothetical protein
MRKAVLSIDADDDFLPRCPGGQMPGATKTPDSLRPLELVAYDRALSVWGEIRDRPLDSEFAVERLTKSMMAFADETKGRK